MLKHYTAYATAHDEEPVNEKDAKLEQMQLMKRFESEDGNCQNKYTDVMEVWFAGCHCGASYNPPPMAQLMLTSSSNAHLSSCL